MADPVTRKVKARGHTYYVDVPHPSEPGAQIRKAAFATRGQEIEVSEEESERGDAFGAFFTGDEGEQVTAAASFSVVDASDDEIDDYLEEHSPNVAETVALAENDPESAERLLDAERRVTGDEPRAGVEKGLEAIINE